MHKQLDGSQPSCLQIFEPHPGSETAYTLVEFMVTIAIIALLALSAIPVLSELGDSLKRSNGRRRVESTVTRARAEAIQRGARSILKATADGKAFTFGIDYPPYNSTLEEDAVDFITNFPEQVTIFIEEPIAFNSQGYLIDENGEYHQIDFSLLLRDISYCEGEIHSLGTVDNEC